MEHRPLAPGIAIAPITLGTNVFGWTADRDGASRLLDRFVERGFNAIDTANVYGNGMSETMIGEWLASRGRRDDVVILTKVGYGEERKGLSATTIAGAIEDSLRRLQTDYVDIYFAHVPDDKAPLNETLEAFDRLVRSGKVRALGASNHSATQVAEARRRAAALGTTPYAVLQPPYNLHDRDAFERELRDLAMRESLGVVPYFALANGFLTGKYRSEKDLVDRQRGRLVKPYLDPRGLRILAAMDDIAAETGASLAQIAIAWLVGQPGVTAPIVSATSVAQLDEILDAETLVLPQDALDRLDAVSRTPLPA